MDNLLKRRRWKWFGQVMRMSPVMPAKTALTWAPEGKIKKDDQEHGGKRWKTN